MLIIHYLTFRIDTHFPRVFVMVPLRHGAINLVSVSESCVTSMTLTGQRIGWREGTPALSRHADINRVITLYYPRIYYTACKFSLPRGCNCVMIVFRQLAPGKQRLSDMLALHSDSNKTFLWLCYLWARKLFSNPTFYCSVKDVRKGCRKAKSLCRPSLLRDKYRVGREGRVAILDVWLTHHNSVLDMCTRHMYCLQ